MLYIKVSSTCILTVDLTKLSNRGETIRVNAVVHIVFECIEIYYNMWLYFGKQYVIWDSNRLSGLAYVIPW